MVLVMPWNSPELEAGPFAAVLDLSGLPAAATMMEVVVVMALLSAFNAQVYGTPRLAYSLAPRGAGPAALPQVPPPNGPGVPGRVSTFFAFLSVPPPWRPPPSPP